MTRPPARAWILCCALSVGLGAATSAADEPSAPRGAVPEPAMLAPPAPTPPALPPPPAYAAPFLLRPAAMGNVVRWDQTLALYSSGNALGATYVSSLSGGYKISGTGDTGFGVQLFGRVSMAYDNAPGTPGDAIFLNPIAGASYGQKLPAHLRLTFTLLSSIPVGMGGGNTPNAAAARARRRARPWTTRPSQ